MSKFLMIVFVLSTILVACDKEKADSATATTDASVEVSGGDVCNLCQDSTSVQDPDATTSVAADVTSVN